MVGGDVGGGQFARFVRDGSAGEIDGRSIEDAPHGDHHVLFADVGLFDQQLKQTDALLLLLFQQLLDLLGREQPVLHEGVCDAFSE